MVSGAPVTYKNFEEPKLWEFHKWKNYYSWESNLTRYKSDMQALITWIATVDTSESIRNVMKIKVNENLFQHEIHLSNIIHDSNYDDKTKKYLIFQKNKIFNTLYQSLDIKPSDISKISYTLELPKDTSGEYEIYLKGQMNELLYPSDYKIN